MPALDHTADTPDATTRFASGEVPQPPCPCCGHVRSISPLAEVVRSALPVRFGRIWDIFGTEVRPNPLIQNPIVSGGLRDLGYAAPPADRRRLGVRALTPPRRPWTMGQAIDRRLTIAIDLAFLGLALFLFGRLVRAVELVDLAAIVAGLALVVALWLAVALATGQFRRANGRAQDRYDRALRRWRALRYCADCGHAFRADGRAYLTPQAVPAYLAREGADAIAPTDR